jgi:hypothetical protein
VRNIRERSFRFLEEALELVQSTGLSLNDVQAVVNHVYSRRPELDVRKEVAGAQITLFTLASAMDIDVEFETEIEVRRIKLNVDAIRTKHEEKPKDIRV